jgi:hypothetical protein
MTWDNTNKEYIATSQTEREDRLIDLWNTYTGANITLDNYSGSGLQGAFFTFIQALGSLENDVVALQSNISNALKDLNQKVLRPPVVLDRCRDLIKQLDLDVAIFDTNFIKLSSEPRGYYLVSKGAIPDDKIDALDELFKKTVVVGIKTYGTTALNTTLSNGEPITYNYTVGELLPDVKIKLRFTRIKKVEPFVTFEENIKIRLVEKYFINFTVANDINPIEIQEAIKDLTTDSAYCEVSYSLDGGTTFIEGYYSIPFDKYLSLVSDDIIIEEV